MNRKCFACEKREIFEEDGKLVQIVENYGYAIQFWDDLDIGNAEKFEGDFEIEIDYCPYCGRDLRLKK